MGVKFNNQKEFRGALYAISSNMIEGWQPTKQDVEQVKDYLTLKQKEKSDD
jgi:putative transcriptional regulator